MSVNHIFFCPTSDTLCPALQLAAKHGHFKTVERLVTQMSCRVGTTGLSAALYEALDHPDIVELLLTKGATLNEALYIAANKGDLKIVKLLLNKGANGLNNALQIAAKQGYLEIVELLITNGATDLNNALQIVLAGKSGHLKMIGKGATVLDAECKCEAAFGGHSTSVELLLAEGATLSKALQIATRQGRPEIIERLSAIGVTDLNIDLCDAASKGDRDAVNMLLAKGAPLHGALYIAASKGHLEIVELLLASQQPLC